MPLLSYEEYTKLGKHKIPYLLRISRDEKYLFFFGEEHSYYPKLKQWDTLKKFWQEFLQLTEGTERISLTEGGVRPVAPNEEEAINKYGGMGLVTFLAHQSGVKVATPEPNEEEERAELEKTFSKDEIQYYYFARVVAQYGRMQNPKPDFENYIGGYLRGDEKESGWEDYDFSLDHMKSIHKKLFGSELSPDNFKHFYDVSNPTTLTTRINEVSRAVGEIRDTHIAKEIQKYWNADISVFASYGCTHVIRQEPLLREFLA